MYKIVEFDKYKRCNAIVLGAAGFIGRWLARYLSVLGANIHLFVRNRKTADNIFSQYDISGIVWQVDVRDFSYIRSLLLELKPDIIFNLAGYGVDYRERDEKTAYQINSELVRVLAETALDTCSSQWEGMSIVHTGSAMEYGQISGDLSEDSIPKPTTLYGESKLKGTLELKIFGEKFGLKCVTARLFTVYGPGEHRGRLLPSLFAARNTNDPILLTAGYQKRDFVYVVDVVEGLLRLGISSAEPGVIINLASGILTSVREFVLIAAKELNISTDRLYFGAIPVRIEEMNHEPVNNQRMTTLLSWSPPTTITEGIKRTIEFHEYF